MTKKLPKAFNMDYVSELYALDRILSVLDGRTSKKKWGEAKDSLIALIGKYPKRYPWSLDDNIWDAFKEYRCSLKKRKPETKYNWTEQEKWEMEHMESNQSDYCTNMGSSRSAPHEFPFEEAEEFIKSNMGYRADTSSAGLVVSTTEYNPGQIIIGPDSLIYLFVKVVNVRLNLWFSPDSTYSNSTIQKMSDPVNAKEASKAVDPVDPVDSFDPVEEIDDGPVELEIYYTSEDGHKLSQCKKCSAITDYEWSKNVGRGLCGNCYNLSMGRARKW